MKNLISVERKLIVKLADKARMHHIFVHDISTLNHPGMLLEHWKKTMTDKELEALRNLNSSHMDNIRWPPF